jgi:hypothetical protein
VGHIKEDAGLHCRIAIHDLPDRFNRSIEDPDPVYIAAIRNRADDGEDVSSRRAKFHRA